MSLKIEHTRSFETAPDGEPPAQQLVASEWVLGLKELTPRAPSERELSDDEQWAAEFRRDFGQEPLESCGRAPRQAQGQSRPSAPGSPGRPASRASSDPPMTAEEMALSEACLDSMPQVHRESRI